MTDNIRLNRRWSSASLRVGQTQASCTCSLALAWLLAQGPDVVPLTGHRCPDRVQQNAAAANLRPAAADLERIECTVPRPAWAGTAPRSGGTKRQEGAPARPRGNRQDFAR